MKWLSKSDLNIKEKRIFILTVIILVFLITFTHLIGYLLASENYYYVGSQPTRRGDMAGHFSFIIQAKDGKALFKNLYSPGDQQALLFHPLWLMMGLIAKLYNLNIFFIYQLFKVILAVFFCLILRKFLREFFDLNKDIWLLPFCIFAGGFFTYLIEKDTFLNLYYSPLFILALILLILIYHSVLRYFKTHQNNQLIIIFICTLSLFLIHFYDTIPVLAVVFLWCVYQCLTTKRFKNLKPSLVTCLAVIIGAIYYCYIFFAEESLSSWAINNFTPLPSLYFFIVGYGFLIPLVIIGIINKRKEKPYLYLIFWCLASLFIILSPIPFNRRFVLGLSIPLTILAYWGLKLILNKLKNYIWRTSLAVIIITLLIQGNLFVVFLDLQIINHYGRPQYLKRSYMETFQWMHDNLPKESIVFANFQYWDTEISGYTGLVSYWAGSYFPSLKENVDRIYWFFKDDHLIEEKKQFLYMNKINHLFYSDIEKRLGTFNPSNKEYLMLVYQNKDVEVYQVLKYNQDDLGG